MTPELQDLNPLEQFLVTPVLPFMKICNLPKGAQRAMNGPVVCVAADMSKTAISLPRSLDDSTILKVKLKRRLQYKGHHMYQAVRINKVHHALSYLKVHHKTMQGMEY